MTEAFRRNNHYVSRGYLKRWASPEKRVWSYRTLVSHNNVPLWKKRSTRGVAYHSHLYTRLIAGRETDEIERWLEHDFETPAAEALEKATSGGRLTPEDWKLLVRFLAAQAVRTPARMGEFLQRWSQEGSSFIEKTMKESIRKAEATAEAGAELPLPQQPVRMDGFPFRLTRKIKPGVEYGELKGEMVVGRGLWLWNVRHLFTKTANVLHKHKWTILAPPMGLSWFTSDNPVIFLHFNNLNDYHFNGGWDLKGTDIIFPLSPRHLLYTTVGYRPQPKWEEMQPMQATVIRRFIAEHAHRMIFASKRDDQVPQLRPREVSAEKMKREREQWAKWHEDQTKTERDLMD